MQVEASGFVTSKGSSAAAAEDGYLIAAFVDGPIAVDPFRD